MKKSYLIRFLLGCLSVTLLLSCVDINLNNGEEEQPATEQERTWSGVNYFAANCMSLYYLWNKEIDNTLKNWLNREITTNPVEKVRSIRYKQGGKDYDRWTEVTDDYESFTSSVGGVSTTYGCDIVLKMLDETHVCAILTVVYADSPAAQAGLKRGDVIVQVNGQTLTKSNYYSLVTDGFLYSPDCNVTLLDPTTGLAGQKVSMTAVKMYENPVVHHSVFDIGSKKVGYLVFTSFTLMAIDDLMDVCAQFKAAGVSELILDLRYNGGGYVTTEEVLASMLAPKAHVLAGDLLEQEVYNAEMTDYYNKTYGANALKTFFQTNFSIKEGFIPLEYNTLACNLDLKKIYAIIDSGTASASESLLVCLMPYMDIRLIGQQSHGKFCTGIMYGAEEWYDDYKDQMSSKLYEQKKDVTNWGLYVMIGRYADKNGNCPAMPDGLHPDVAAEDIPEYGYDFGDERDPMLRQALILAGRNDLKTLSTRAQAPGLSLTPEQIRKPVFGKRILLKP